MADIYTALKQQIFHVAQLSGNRTYIKTTTRITSGEELKQRNGLGDFARDLRAIPGR